jgi:hypothetical protein
MHTNPEIRTDAPRKIKHFQCAATFSIVFVLLAFAMSACGAAKSMKPKENVRPPQPGVPSGPSDVQGIYRTVHQGLLQLRANGQFVMIIPEGPGPSGGSYTLADGTLTVRTDTCGSAVGEYRIMVNGPPLPGQATLVFTPVNDDCGPRQRYLTIDPWVYANS